MNTVKEDTLLDMIEYMTSKVGLVHQLPFTCDREGFAATFEKVIHHVTSYSTIEIDNSTRNFHFVCRYFSERFSRVSIYRPIYWV